MPTIFLTHSTKSRGNHYGENAISGLRALAVVRMNENAEPLDIGDLIASARGCEIIVADRATAVPAEIFSALPDLAAVVRVTVDCRNIDIAAASRNGVLVTHASAGFMASVAELVIGYMVDLSRHISDAVLAYRNSRAPDDMVGRQLNGSSIGVVGYGAIGRELCSLAVALGMRVLTFDPYVDEVSAGIEATDFDRLLQTSDFVVCLAIADKTTEGLFGTNAFKQMKPDAYFINVSRSMLVDEAALGAALDQGGIAGAAIDVGSAPDQMPNPDLAAHPRVIATPHIGGLTPEATSHQALESVRQCGNILAGRVPDGAHNASEASRLAVFQKRQ